MCSKDELQFEASPTPQTGEIFGMYQFDDVKPDAGDDETPVVYSVAMDAFKIINKKELLCLTLFTIDAQSVADPKSTIVAEATEQRKEENEEYTALMASDAAAKELLESAKNQVLQSKALQASCKEAVE